MPPVLLTPRDARVVVYMTLFASRSDPDEFSRV